MEAIEFYRRLDLLKDEFEDKVGKVEEEYALSHNKVKIGDIITDHIGCIKVDSISVTKIYGSTLPLCAYHGEEYTKKGVAKKNGNNRVVWQSNLIKD